MNTIEGWTEVAFNNRDPVYMQVVRHFKERIATGRSTAGQIIPSRRELGAFMKINPNTVQKAYKEMEDQQLIITEGNSPSRITSDTRVLNQIREELLGDAVRDFWGKVKNIDVPIEELLLLVERHFREEGEKK
ncbi:GntR family transcriptional regulator [Paenibacillus sp. 2TAB23]|uniref:GntR family transcriptional regulator n=1 Tax=Paenibacillus sp. 2TAB23 TaxID=3233004 RepID=UPI003F9E7CE0